MWYEDYDPEEPSEVDQIIQDAICKVEEYIIDNSKLRIDEIINSAQKWEQKYKDCKLENKKFFSDILDRDRQIKELQAELERKRTQLGILPFEVNDDVYYIYQSYQHTEKLTCPICNGTGKITHIHDGQEFYATCPTCKGSSYCKDHPKQESTYQKYIIGRGPISIISQRIKYDTKSKSPKSEVYYYINNCNNTDIPVEHIRLVSKDNNRKGYEELQELANALNRKLFINACKEVGRSIPHESNT